MTTISFKLPEEEARRIRMAASHSRATLSEYVRRRLLEGLPRGESIRRATCRYTGATIFRSKGDSSPFGVADVREMMRDFP